MPIFSNSVKSMKSLKLKDYPSSVQNLRSKQTRVPMIQHSVEIENLQDLQMQRKKNYSTSRITNFCFQRVSLNNKFLRSNSKHLRSFSSSLEGLYINLPFLKVSNHIKKIHFLDSFDTPLGSRGFHNDVRLSSKNAKKTLRLVLRNKRFLDGIEMKVSMISCLSDWSIYELRKIKNLCIKKEALYSSKIYQRSRSALQQQLEIDKMLPRIKHFKSLTKFCFSSQTINSSQEFFMEIFQRLSDMGSLTELEIDLMFDRIPKKAIKMRETMKKFRNLNTLTLRLEFKSNSQCGGLFMSLQPLENLKCLVIDIDSNKTFDCSDLSAFIGSLRSLTVLKFTSQPLLFQGYNQFLDGIQKLKNLKRLSIQQQNFGNEPSSFAYGKISKTILSFQFLQALDVQLPACSQDEKEMNGILICLTKHPSLKKANISLVTSLKQKYKFDDQFFNNLSKVINILEKFEVDLFGFPEDIKRKISKTIGLKSKQTSTVC